MQSLAASEPAALQQADSLCQNAGAWAARLGERHSLYRDIVQPVQLAVRELQYGVSLMAGGCRLAANPGSLAVVLSVLLAFPRLPLGIGASGVAAGQDNHGKQTDSPLSGASVLHSSHAREVVAASAAGLAKHQLAGKAGISQDQVQRAGKASAAISRLQLLRVAAHDATRGMAIPSPAAAMRATADGVFKLHGIFKGALSSASCWELS